jgi:hypothetical protein
VGSKFLCLIRDGSPETRTLSIDTRPLFSAT